MAKADTITAGKSIFERAMAKLPKEQQEALSSVLSNEDFVTEIGSSALRQEDYSRLADEARAAQVAANKLHKDNLDWYTTRVADLGQIDEYKTTMQKMKEAGWSQDAEGNPVPPASGGTVAPPAGLSKKELDERFSRTESQGLSVMATLTNLGLSHLNEFKETIDTNNIIKTAQTKGLTLEGAYDSLVAERRVERNNKEIEKRIVAAREEGVKEGLTKSITAPYPVSGASAAPSTLSGLTKKGGTANPDFSVDGAIKSLNLSRLGKSA